MNKSDRRIEQDHVPTGLGLPIEEILARRGPLQRYLVRRHQPFDVFVWSEQLARRSDVFCVWAWDADIASALVSGRASEALYAEHNYANSQRQWDAFKREERADEKEREKRLRAKLHLHRIRARTYHTEPHSRTRQHARHEGVDWPQSHGVAYHGLLDHHLAFDVRVDRLDENQATPDLPEWRLHWPKRRFIYRPELQP